MTREELPKRFGAGKRVLVVNDTQEILELFTDILEGLGFETVVMSYAPRELEQVRMTEPDLIILDFIFGSRELAGWQLLQKIRMDAALQDLPVIVCTAAVREVLEQQGYLTEQGVLVVLKPFTISQLEESLERATRIADSPERLASRRKMRQRRKRGEASAPERSGDGVRQDA